MIGRTGHIRLIFFTSSRLIFSAHLLSSVHLIFILLSSPPHFTSRFRFRFRLAFLHRTELREGHIIFRCRAASVGTVLFAFSDIEKGKKGGKKGRKQKKSKKKRKKMRKGLEKWWIQGKLGEER